jgi:hypothetical protein
VALMRAIAALPPARARSRTTGALALVLVGALRSPRLSATFG